MRVVVPNSIGLLRLVLAAMVVYSHSYYLGQFGPEPLMRVSDYFLGGIAVQGFFVLSGYLVSKSFIQQPSVGRYLWHRFLRLAPAFWGCLIVTALVFTPWVSESASYIFANALSPRAQINIGPYPQTWNGDWNGSLWTLRYEAICYALTVAVGLVGLLTRFRWAYLILIVCAIVVRPEAMFDTPGKILAWFFVGGALFAVFPKIIPNLSWMPGKGFESKVGGDYSYGLYLYGYPVAELLLAAGWQRYGVEVFFMTSLVLALACAILSWHLIEKRALNMKSLRLRRSVIPG